MHIKENQKNEIIIIKPKTFRFEQNYSKNIQLTKERRAILESFITLQNIQS